MIKLGFCWSMKSASGTGFINVGTGGESHLVNVKSGLNARYNQGHHTFLAFTVRLWKFDFLFPKPKIHFFNSVLMQLLSFICCHQDGTHFANET